MSESKGEIPYLRLSEKLGIFKNRAIEILNFKDGKYFISSRYKNPIEFCFWIDEEFLETSPIKSNFLE